MAQSAWSFGLMRFNAPSLTASYAIAGARGALCFRSLQALFGVNYLAVIPEMKRPVVLSGSAVASTASCDLRGRTCYARKRLP